LATGLAADLAADLAVDLAADLATGRNDDKTAQVVHLPLS
jgi:hypothetical protein